MKLPKFCPHDALLLVDMQNDFCPPSGAVPVTDCGEVVQVLNAAIAAAEAARIPIFASRDWHPPDHKSFDSQGGPWPAHCVQGTQGAAFCEELHLPPRTVIVSKGTAPDAEQYSPFAGSGLADMLRAQGVQRLWIGGVAQDVCVRAAVLDAIEAGFEVHLIVAGTAPADADAGRRALREIQSAGAILEAPRAPEKQPGSEQPEVAAAFTDLYELTMVQSYLRERMTAPAVFELFFRELPASRNFIVAAGLDPLLEMLEGLHFSETELDYLRAQDRFSQAFLDQLAAFRFTGDVWAVPEGTVIFPNEPLVQVIAPLPEAQLIETLVLNQIHFASVAASKAARLVLAARGKRVIDFGSRRAHGIDAGLIAARSSYLAGCDGTSLVEAGRRYGIPIVGTMAHSYIQAHDDEANAFEDFVKSFPEATLLVDTYDTLQGVRHVIDLRRRLGEAFRVRAIRLDSGDLLELARKSRQLLDEAGLQDVEIVASGGLDEFKLQNLIGADAPIDGYGVGTSLAVSDDAPALDMAYKLVEYGGRPRTKLSSSKVLYPGRKQIFRQVSEGVFTHDVLAPAEAEQAGSPLLELVMQHGVRRKPADRTLQESRAHARTQLQALPGACRALSSAADSAYRVAIAASLEQALQRIQGSNHMKDESCC